MLPALLSPPAVTTFGGTALCSLALRTLAFRTVGESADGLLPFGWDVAGFQKWTLIYLGVSSLAFVLVWLVGFLRR